MCAKKKAFTAAKNSTHPAAPPPKYKIAKIGRIHYIGRVMKLLKHTWLRTFLWILLISLSIWSCGVVYYMILSSLFIPYIAILLVLYAMMIWKKTWISTCTKIMGGISLCLLGFYCYYPASNDRLWLSSWEKLPEATIQGNILTIHQLRDFRYTSEHEFQNTYVTRQFPLDKLESLDLFVSHWDNMEGIAHTMLSFGFSNGQYLTLSCETRKEKNKIDDLIGGIFKQSHFIYIWGSEEDLIALRTNYRHEEVYLYRVVLSRQDIRTLLVSFLERSNELLTKPEFYNTLTHNCTTAFIPSFQRIDPNIRFRLRLISNGNIDRYTFEKQGLQRHENESFEALKARSRIPFDSAKEDRENYSTQIRKSVGLIQ